MRNHLRDTTARMPHNVPDDSLSPDHMSDAAADVHSMQGVSTDNLSANRMEMQNPAAVRNGLSVNDKVYNSDTADTLSDDDDYATDDDATADVRGALRAGRRE
jgi:hypothetical protein